VRRTIGRGAGWHVARHDLFGAEWLGNVVVAADGQTSEPVLEDRTCGPGADATGTQSAQKFKVLHAGQCDLEDHGVGPHRGRAPQRRARRPRCRPESPVPPESLSVLRRRWDRRRPAGRRPRFALWVSRVQPPSLPPTSYSCPCWAIPSAARRAPSNCPVRQCNPWVVSSSSWARARVPRSAPRHTPALPPKEPPNRGAEAGTETPRSGRCRPGR
jgi:hypothetical protein